MAIDGKKIRQLRKEAGFTQETLGKKLGVIKQTVSSWENNISEPNSEILSNIASIFNVSVDYLLETKNFYNQSTDENIKKERKHSYFFFFFDDLLKNIFTSRLKKTLSDKGLSEDEFCKLVSFNTEKCSSYLNGECEPSLEDLVKIANALNVSIDYLLDTSKRKIITEEEEMLLQSFNQCDDECKKYLIAKAGVLCVEGISAVAAGEYGKYADEGKKSYPSSGTEGKNN